MTTPTLIGPGQQCVCKVFSYINYIFGYHFQTCQTKSAHPQVHDWVVYKLGSLLGSVGHRVKIHKITPATGNLIMDFTMTHVRFGRSHLHPMGQLTNTRRSDGTPDPDGTLKEESRIKIRNYHNVYLNRPDPIVFIPLTVENTGRLYDDFIRLFFFHTHRETSTLGNELQEESDQFRFLRGSSRPFISLPRFIRSCRPTPFFAPSLILFPPCSA